MSKPAPKSEELEKRFEDLIRFIDEANENVQADRVTDLGPLDKNVALLCKELEKAPAPLARMLEPLMARMISRLDYLAQSLNDYQTRTGNKD